MKNSNTKFQTETADSATPETTNAMEIAVTETTTDVALTLPDGIDLAGLLAQTELLNSASVSMSLKADYLELTLGQSFRGLFLGFGTATHKNPNAVEGENSLVEKKSIKLLGADKKAYINSSILLVRDFEQAGLAIGTPVQITMSGTKTMPNGFKAKEYDVALLA
jgi:hypothetical protein